MWSFNLFTTSSCFPNFSRRPGFSGSRFFWVRVQVLGPGFRSSQFLQRCKNLSDIMEKWYYMLNGVLTMSLQKFRCPVLLSFLLCPILINALDPHFFTFLRETCAALHALVPFVQFSVKQPWRSINCNKVSG